jgi:hypothetical protein
MTLRRRSFFLLLFVVMVLPLPLYKLIWVAGSTVTTGNMDFVGHGNLGSVFGISTYPVIRFKHGGRTLYFNGNVNIPLKENQPVSVRYHESDPEDAKINEFSSIWGDTLAYTLGPLLIFLVIFFHPDLVPKDARILLEMRRPWIRFI